MHPDPAGGHIVVEEPCVHQGCRPPRRRPLHQQRAGLVLGQLLLLGASHHLLEGLPAARHRDERRVEPHPRALADRAPQRLAVVAPEPPAAPTARGEDLHAAGEAVAEVCLAGVRRRRQRGAADPGKEGGEARPGLLGGRRRPEAVADVGSKGGVGRRRAVGLAEEVDREGDGVDGEDDEKDPRDEAAEPVPVAVGAAGHHRRRAAGVAAAGEGSSPPGSRRSRGCRLVGLSLGSNRDSLTDLLKASQGTLFP